MVLGDDNRRYVLFAAVTREVGQGMDFGRIRPVIASIRQRHGVGVQFIRPEGIFGKEHLVMALEKARENVGNKSNVADDLLLETLRIASGKRQIKEALAALGVAKRCSRFFIFLLWEGRRDTQPEVQESLLRDVFRELCGELGLQEESPCALETLSASQGRVATGREPGELKKGYIERMAVVDL